MEHPCKTHGREHVAVPFASLEYKSNVCPGKQKLDGLAGGKQPRLIFHLDLFIPSKYQGSSDLEYIRLSLRHITRMLLLCCLLIMRFPGTSIFAAHIEPSLEPAATDDVSRPASPASPHLPLAREKHGTRLEQLLKRGPRSVTKQQE